MLLLLLGTLAFFVPHALMVGIREVSEKLPFSVPHRFMVDLLKIFEKKKIPENEVDPEDAA